MKEQPGQTRDQDLERNYGVTVFRGRHFTFLPDRLKPGRWPKSRFETDGAVAVDHSSGLIRYAGSWKEFTRRHQDLSSQLSQGTDAARLVQLDAHEILAPGFVDAHVHLPQINVAGRTGVTLLDWLKRYIFPAEAEFSKDLSIARATSRHFFRSLGRAGTTTAVVMGSGSAEATHVAFEEAAAAGLRIFLGPVLMNQQAPTWYRRKGLEQLDEVETLARRWQGANGGLLEVVVTPRFAITCSRDLLEGAADLSRRLSLLMHTHLNETKEEIAFTRRVHSWWKGSYTGLYQKTGVIGDLPRPIVLAHQIYPTSRELDALISFPVCIAHCPSSNFALRSGAELFDFWKVYGGGKRHVGLGSDVGAGARLDLFDQIQHAMYSRVGNLNTGHAWYLATLGGAEGLHLNTGALEAGREADLIRLDTRAVLPGIPEWPTYSDRELLSVLGSRGAGSGVVRQTYVRGELVFDRSNESTVF